MFCSEVYRPFFPLISKNMLWTLYSCIYWHETISDINIALLDSLWVKWSPLRWLQIMKKMIKWRLLSLLHLPSLKWGLKVFDLHQYIHLNSIHSNSPMILMWPQMQAMLNVSSGNFKAAVMCKMSSCCRYPNHLLSLEHIKCSSAHVYTIPLQVSAGQVVNWGGKDRECD